MSVARSRLLDLAKVRCRIFSTTFNPDGLRLGNKVLRQRLRGPAMASYYPPRVATIKDLQKAFPDNVIWDDKEVDRLESVQNAKARGKGAPKKKKSSAESKKFQKKRKAPTITA